MYDLVKFVGYILNFFFKFYEINNNLFDIDFWFYERNFIDIYNSWILE